MRLRLDITDEMRRLVRRARRVGDALIRLAERSDQFPAGLFHRRFERLRASHVQALRRWDQLWRATLPRGYHPPLMPRDL